MFWGIFLPKLSKVSSRSAGSREALPVAWWEDITRITRLLLFFWVMHKHRMFFSPSCYSEQVSGAEKYIQFKMSRCAIIAAVFFSELCAKHFVLSPVKALWHVSEVGMKVSGVPFGLQIFSLCPSIWVFLGLWIRLLHVPFSRRLTCVSVRWTSLKTMTIAGTFLSGSHKWMFLFLCSQKNKWKFFSLNTILTKKRKEKTNLSGHASIHLHQGSVHMI